MREACTTQSLSHFMLSWLIPRIEYPVTREFESKLFNRLAYGAAFLSLVIITIVNGVCTCKIFLEVADLVSSVAVVGYEPDVVLSSNFKETRSFWYHNVAPPPKPGTQCDPRVFNVGESVITNASLFEWKIVAISKPSAGNSGIAYSGTTLDYCDVMQLNVIVDLRTWTLGSTAYIACREDDGLEVMASTTLAFSALPGYRSPFLREAQSPDNDPVSTSLMNL